MSLNFYFNGCSFTQGAELQNEEESRFSKLFSNAAGAKEINEARGGGSNQRILRMFVEAVNREKIDFVFIMWTSLDRFEHYAGREDRGFDSVTVHRLDPQAAKTRKPGVWNHYSQYDGRSSVRDALLKYMLEVRTDSHKVAEFLNYILTVQTICKSKGIPYMMSNYQHQQTINLIDKVIDNLKAEENTQAYEWMTDTYNLIDWSKFLFNKDFAFLEFAKQYNFSIGSDGHPLEDAHSALAKQIYKKYKRIAKKDNNEY